MVRVQLGARARVWLATQHVNSVVSVSGALYKCEDLPELTIQYM